MSRDNLAGNLNERWPKTFPASVKDLDIRHHALIEASAGTGKTYAIEHLVMRLMLEDVHLKPEQILLLSFTEKTAADLRKRIRERLHAEWAGEGKTFWTREQVAQIRRAWLHCDDLAIHTIHGFCHAALLRDPIANNALIRPEVLDDMTLAHDALENLLRGAWARDPGRLARLRDALDISGKDGWRDRLIALTLALQEKRGDIIDPPRDPGMVASLELEAETMTGKLFEAIRGVAQSSFPVSDHRKAFAFTKTGRPKKDGDDELRKDAYHKVFKLAEDLSEDAAEFSPAERMTTVLSFFKEQFKGNTRVAKRGWENCLPDGASGLSVWTDLATICKRLWNLTKEIEAARLLEKLGLQAEAARELRKELAREKRRRGAVSYDDMTQNLAEALGRNPELVHRLRGLYKFCIVDEFQDTDLQQWSILHTLCLQGTPEGTLDNHAPPLFLVGDPKQAIYAFRGGDLHTYLEARDALRDLAEQNPPRAQGVALAENFRSGPELIESLNTVFEQADWFGAADPGKAAGAWKLSTSKEIVFTRVKPGLAKAENKAAPADRNTGKHSTQQVKPSLWIRDFRPEGDQKSPPKRLVERHLRNWIAARVLDLTTGRDGLTILPKNRTVRRTPRFDDIAVLVRKHSEAAAIEKLLRKQGIPCRVRRTGGVFHGEGADALRLLLDLIPSAADPGIQAKILLLPFLRRRGADWPAGRPATTPPQLERWMLLAKAGRWPEFFDSVLRDSGHLARVAEESESDAARLLALGRALGEAGSTPGTSAGILADRFDALRRGEGEGNEGVVEDGHDGEGEENEENEGDEKSGGDVRDAATGGAVTVMTLHMSKGLEFPVVFVAASGVGKKPDFYTLREEHGFRHVLDKANDEAKARYAEQSKAEDKRLFYVAFTRARDRLYAPLLPASTGKSNYGPLGGFAANALAAVAGSEGQAVIQWDAGPVHAEHAGTTARMQPQPVAGTRSPGITQTQTEGSFERLRRLDSYSGLSRIFKSAAGRPHIPDLLGEDGKRTVRDEVALEIPVDDALSPARDMLPPESLRAASGPDAPITREELPAGAAAGNALHNLLEVTDFVSVLQTATPAEWLERPGRRDQVENLLRREGLNPECAGAIARAVWNTLRMPLPDPARQGESFRLADNAAHLHEVEFLFPVDGTSLHAGTGPIPEGTVRSGNFLWGFIDLVFRHQDRYYLLDWKSNLLDAYDDITVEAAMRASGYDLQWQLYAVALDRWLQARLPGYDPKAHFGGVLYLYLRGASPDQFSGFRYRPTVEDLKTRYPDRLKDLLGLQTATTPREGAA